MLHDRDARTLARLRARQRWLLAAGALLFVLGATYRFWAVGSTTPLPDHAAALTVRAGGG